MFAAFLECEAPPEQACSPTDFLSRLCTVLKGARPGSDKMLCFKPSSTPRAATSLLPGTLCRFGLSFSLLCLSLCVAANTGLQGTAVTTLLKQSRLSLTALNGLLCFWQPETIWPGHWTIPPLQLTENAAGWQQEAFSV